MSSSISSTLLRYAPTRTQTMVMCTHVHRNVQTMRCAANSAHASASFTSASCTFRCTNTSVANGCSRRMMSTTSASSPPPPPPPPPPPALPSTTFDSMTPEAIVAELDKNVIGQSEAKRAVAMALRNRWRRKQLSSRMQEEVYPMNILMIGSTGTGKTEIARRLAKISQAPFVKTELTRYTETGIYGNDIADVIHELVRESVRIEAERARAAVTKQAQSSAEQKLANALRRSPDLEGTPLDKIRTALKEKDPSLLDRMVDVMLPRATPSKFGGDLSGGGGGGAGMPFAINIAGIGGPGAGKLGGGGAFGGGIGAMDDLVNRLSQMLPPAHNEDEANGRQRVLVRDALKAYVEAEIERLIDEKQVVRDALKQAEEMGIVFLDEVDKLARSTEYAKGGSKGEGVQRELLALLEGTVVHTRYGPVKTDHVLFIAGGAFHAAKPSDLMPELQGRLPVRVSLSALTMNDFLRILTEKEFNLIDQQVALMQTEGVSMLFTDDAIQEVARLAEELNARVENIGARRLTTIMARVVSEISFTAPSAQKQVDANGERVMQKHVIDAEYVRKQVQPLMATTDLRKFVL